MSASREKSQTPQHILECLSPSIRFLFNGGPFTVVDLRLEEFREKLAKATIAVGSQREVAKPALTKTAGTAVPIGLLAIFQEAGLRLGTVCPSQLLMEHEVEDDPALLLEQFIKKSSMLDLLIEAVKGDSEGVHQELLVQFQRWNRNPSKDDPITKKITELKQQIQAQPTQAQSAERIAAAKLSPLVNILFKSESGSAVPFVLSFKEGLGSTTAAECIRLFNDKIERYFKGELDSISAEETIAKGWRLISEYKGKGDVFSTEDVFFNQILPALRKLHRQLKILEQLENQRAKAASHSKTALADFLAFRESIMGEMVASVKRDLPAMLSIAGESVKPMQASIDAVAGRVELVARGKIAQAEEDRSRAELAARERESEAARLKMELTARIKTPAVAAKPTLFASPAAMVSEKLRVYKDFQAGEPEILYTETGFYDTYQKQVGGKVPSELKDLDAAMNKLESLGADVTTYRYETWNWLVAQIRDEGAIPNAAIKECVAAVQEAATPYAAKRSSKE